MTVVLTNATGPAFRHEALLYAGDHAFVHAVLPFIVEGLDRNEPIMVAVSAAKIERLRAHLGWGAHWVDFVDMAAIGTNPGRIISAWRRFVASHPDDPHLRGIGEPVWAERTAEELVECGHHELLLNAAFAPERPWRLLCPYDTAALHPRVIEAAGEHHPFVVQHGAEEASSSYRGGRQAFAAVLEAPLAEPDASVVEVPFGADDRTEVRRRVLHHAARLSPRRADDLARAVDELTANSVRHGGGGGVLRLWLDGGRVVCEVRDDGHIRDPLVGRGVPPRRVAEGSGLWLVHELCDLVQLRSSAQGTVVRLSIAGH